MVYSNKSLMYFNFEDRHFDTPTVESAVSWREQLLVSLFGHIAALAVILVVPSLPFVESAAQRRAERRAERILELAELQRQAPPQERDEGTFVFMAPRVETEADVPPRPDAFLSDRDRVAASPESALDAENRLPNAEGNSADLVEADEPSDALDPSFSLTTEDDESPQDAALVDEPLEADRVAEAAAGQGETNDAREDRLEDAGALAEDFPGVGARADSSLTRPGSGAGTLGEESDREDRLVEDLLGQARETLRRSLSQQSFGNVTGDTGRYGPEIQFDAKGANFGPWIRRFVAQIRRNWMWPYAVLSNHGHVVMTFNVNRDGSITDLSVLEPSGIDAFNRSASNALSLSNPTQPLPADYPDQQAFFTVTFFFNEVPPSRTY